MQQRNLRSSKPILTPSRPVPKRRRHPDFDSKPDLPSPPQSIPAAEPPSKRPRTHRNQGKGRSANEHRTEEGSEGDKDPLRPPRFWDHLSRVPLVRGALQELERRNKDFIRPPARSIPGPTIRSLRLFARHGGPDLSELCGFEETEMPSGRQTRRGSGRHVKGGVNKTRQSTRGGGTSSGRKTKSSSPYDAAFKQHLIDYQVWPINHLDAAGNEPPPPSNLQDIIMQIEGARESLEPTTLTGEDFRHFKTAYHMTTAEEPRSRTLELVEGALSVSTTQVKRGPFKMAQLHALTPDNLVPGYPDRAYGSRPEELNLAIRQDSSLRNLILPSSAQDILCPNFIVHVKGPGGTQEVASIQAVYDGALAARGMEALWAYGSEGNGQDPLQVARTLTCTFASGVLRMYAVHLRACDSGDTTVQRQQSASRGKGVEYITTEVGAWIVDSRFEDFRRAAAAFRNGLEWARHQREMAIERANQIHPTQPSQPAQGVDDSDGRPGSSSSADPIA